MFHLLFFYKQNGEDGEPSMKKSKSEPCLEMKFDDPTVQYSKDHQNDKGEEHREKQETIEQKELFDFPDDVWYYRHIGGKRFAVVKAFNRQVYVNIREYYKSPYNGSRMMAGKRGLNLTAENWKQLAQGVQDINAAVEAQELLLLNQ